MRHTVDVEPKPIQEAALLEAFAAGRLKGMPRLVRVLRSLKLGGYADTQRFPDAYALIATIDGTPRVLYSARARRRELTSLDRWRDWLRERGFTRWVVEDALKPKKTNRAVRPAKRRTKGRAKP
jgi:hypothetical protein